MEWRTRPWRWRPIWWHIRVVKETLKNIDEEYERKLEQESTEFGQREIKAKWHDIWAFNFEPIEDLLTKQLVKKARRWWVNPPPINHRALEDYKDPNWEHTRHRRCIVLRPEAQEQIKQRIWTRRIEVAALVFGGSSIIQAFYAVLAYHWPKP